MRFPCRLMTGVAALIVAMGLSASAQTDTNEGADESELRDRVRQLEEQREQSLEREISALKEEISQLEQAAAKRQAAGGEVLSNRAKPAAASDNLWRFKYHQGRWWYWMPDKQWVYWSTNRWLQLPQRTAAAQATAVPAAGSREAVEAERAAPAKTHGETTRVQ